MKFVTFSGAELSQVTNGQASCAGPDDSHSIELGMRIMAARIDAAIPDHYFTISVKRLYEAMERPAK